MHAARILRVRSTVITVPAKSGLTRRSRVAQLYPRTLAAVIAAALALVCYPIAGIAQNPTVTITVDATADRHPIDPNVYGVAHATTAQMNDLNTPLNRNGGNNTTRYINGATTQADVFGVFGREGLDMGARWATPVSSTPTYKAMKMYRNYDGNKSAFGDTSVRAATANPDAVSAFAALRSADGALTVMAINKQLSTSSTATINLSTFAHRGTAQVWQLTAANAIGHLADIGFGGTSFVATLPPQSVTLFVVPGSLPVQPAAPTNVRVIR